MKPTLLALKYVSALVLASLSYSYSQTIVNTTISQSDADRYKRFLIISQQTGSPKFSHYYLNGDIEFNGYDTAADNFGYHHDGNVFYYSGGSGDYIGQSMMSGENNGVKYSLVFKNCLLTKEGADVPTNRQRAQGGAANFGNHVFKDFKNVVFEDNAIRNTATNNNATQTSGGALKTYALNLDNIDNFIVQNNTISGIGDMAGGGISVYNIRTGTMDDTVQHDDYSNISIKQGTGTGNIYFINNGCIAESRTGITGGSHLSGGALHNGEGAGTAKLSAMWYNTGKIVFSGNYLKASDQIIQGSTGTDVFHGGAYYYLPGTYFNNTKDVIFDGNYIDASLDTGVVDVAGGAVYASTFQMLNVHAENETDPSIVFANNKAIANSVAGSSGRGGALNISRFYLQDSGDVLFANNCASTNGGAIYIRRHGGKGFQNVFTANEGDITFIGNTDSLSGAERNSGKSNAIYVQTATAASISDGDIPKLFIRATEGHSVNFYDPITTNVVDRNSLYLYLNSGGDDYTGDLLFSGRYVKDSLAGSEGTADYQQRVADSKKTDVNANIYLYNGKLTLEEGVTLGRKFDEDNPDLGTGAYFWMSDNATLDISGSTENGATTIAGRFIALNEGIVKIGNMSRFDANDIYIEEGFKLDMGYYFTPDTARQLGISQAEHSGLQIAADSMELGGSIQLLDSRDEYFYTDIFWAEDRRFIIFDAASVNPENIDGDFEGIISELTESNIVDDTYQRQGIWSLEWEDGQLVALWQNTNPEIEEIRPEMDGTAMLNTLWSTASNVQAMGRAGAAQMGIHRFKYGKDRNFWGQGLADFSSHGRRGDRDGYDYNGGGYAVGMDHRMGKHFVTGFGVGQLKGDNRSRGYNIKTSQDTFMGMLYTEYNNQLNKKNNLDIQLIGVYGNTTNKSRTTYNRGVSQGKWDNDAWMLDLYATWTRDLGSNWSLTPYIGLEYTIANQDGFTETGYAARRFNSDKMRNLAMPIGMGVGKLVSFNNGMHWLNELKVSYVPDLYRKNPETQAEWLDQEFTWYAKGVAPVRNAARIEYNSRLQLSQRWSLYGGYMYEGRRNANYHQVNLGASYSF